MQHTLYLATGGGDLRHTEVGGANDIIVTGSVPEMRKKALCVKNVNFILESKFIPNTDTGTIRKLKTNDVHSMAKLTSRKPALKMMLLASMPAR